MHTKTAPVYASTPHILQETFWQDVQQQTEEEMENMEDDLQYAANAVDFEGFVEFGFPSTLLPTFERPAPLT